MTETEDRGRKIIEQTRNWIQTVVIGCNFCPFAAREVRQNSIHFEVEHTTAVSVTKDALLREFARMDNDKAIETTLLIFPNLYHLFSDYLAYVSVAEKLLSKKGYTGKYQLASFHPLYEFAGSETDEAANFTNRSVYPMIHILREKSITRALRKYPDAGAIPQRNVDFARRKGAAYMQMLRDSCL